jgi:hypothetical protein
MRLVGILYLFMFVVAGIVRVPIRVMAPAGTLAEASAGNPVARLLVDTWVTLGLEFCGVGLALLVASRAPERATALIWAVLGIELVRGIGTDVYMIARGYDPTPHVVWIVIHAVVIATGWRALSSLRRHP